MDSAPLVLVVLCLLVAGCTGGVLNSATGGAPSDPPAATPTATATPPESPTATPTESSDTTLSASGAGDRTTTADPSLSDGGPDDGSAWMVTVDRIVDGRTIQVTFPNGATDTIRLLGVYTPKASLGDSSPREWGLSFTYENRRHLVTWGDRAGDHARNELKGMQVRIEVDEEAGREGDFGRLHVYLYAHGGNFNRHLVANGYAKVSDGSFTKRAEFEDAERAARADRVGLWDYEEFPTPEEPSTESGSSGSGSGGDGDRIPPLPPDGDYDCSDFDSQEQAQVVLEETPGNPHRIDADGDGVACEGLS